MVLWSTKLEQNKDQKYFFFIIESSIVSTKEVSLRKRFSAFSSGKSFLLLFSRTHGTDASLFLFLSFYFYFSPSPLPLPLSFSLLLSHGRERILLSSDRPSPVALLLPFSFVRRSSSRQRQYGRRLQGWPPTPESLGGLFSTDLWRRRRKQVRQPREKVLWSKNGFSTGHFQTNVYWVLYYPNI